MVMNLLSVKKMELVGIDVGSSAVKLIKLGRSGCGYTVRAAAMAEIPSPSADSADASGIVGAIRQCLSIAQVKDRCAVCGVAGPEVMVRGFKFPPLPAKALDQAVQLEAHSVCPLDMKNSVLDYQLIGHDIQTQEPRPQNGLMVAASDRLIQQRLAQLTGAGMKPVLMDSEALALLNCLNELNLLAPGGSAAVIDIGDSVTSVIIYGQNGLPFVRDLNIAGGSIIRQIAAEQQMEEKTVRNALCSGGRAEITTEQRNKILLALNNAIRPLVMMINETLRFYSFQEKGSPVEQIFLCGGFSLVEMFTDMLTDALPVCTTILNPLEKIEWESPQDQNRWKACGPVMAIAAGLAMRTI